MRKFAPRAAGELWFGIDRAGEVIRVKIKMKSMIGVVLAAEAVVVLILLIAILLTGNDGGGKKVGGESAIMIEESETVEDWGEIDWN